MIEAKKKSREECIKIVGIINKYLQTYKSRVSIEEMVKYASQTAKEAMSYEFLKNVYTNITKTSLDVEIRAAKRGGYDNIGEDC